MKLQEKKYLVDSFAPILKLIKEWELKKVKEVTSVHYYGSHKGNDVEKFVVYPDRVEAHVWKETGGKFIPTESFPLKDEKEGFAWLKKRGYKIANIVKMDYAEYKYKKGTVGLYTIDDTFFSVILNFTAGEHSDAEKVLGLMNAEVITIPYDRMLKKAGMLRTMNLD